MKKMILITSILAVLALMVACSLSPVITGSTSNQQPVVVEEDTPVERPVEQEPEPQADQPAEPTFGEGTFTLDLPDGWDVIGPEMIEQRDRSYALYLLGPDPASMDGPGASKVIIANASEWTPQEIALMQCSTCPDNGFEEVTLDGEPALRTQIGGGGVPFMLTWYFVEHNGQLIGIDIHDPSSLESLPAVTETIQLQ